MHVLAFGLIINSNVSYNSEDWGFKFYFCYIFIYCDTQSHCPKGDLTALQFFKAVWLSESFWSRLAFEYERRE